MIKVSDYIHIENIVMHTPAQNKNEAIRMLTNASSRNNPFPEHLTDLVIAKEQTRSTGFGKEVAIPHIMHKDVPSIHIGMCFFDPAVDWQSKDGKAVRIGCVIMVSNRLANSYMDILYAISKMLSDDYSRSALLSCRTTSDVFTTMRCLDTKAKKE